MQLKDVSGRAKVRAEELRVRLRTLPSYTASQATLGDDQLARGLAHASHTAESLVSAAQRTAEVISAALEQLYPVHLYDQVVVQRYTDGRAEFEFDPEDQRERYCLQLLLSDTLMDGTHLWGSGILLGNRRLVRELPECMVRGWAALRCMLHTPQLSEPWDLDDVYYPRLPVAGTADLQRCCEAAHALTAAVVGFREISKNIGAVSGQLRDAAHGTLGNDTHPNGRPTGELALQQKWQRDWLAQAPRWLLLEPSQLASYALGKATLLLNYIDRCLQHHQPTVSASESTPI